MNISTKDWKNYIDKLSALDKKAGELMQEWIRKNGFADRDALIDYAYAVATKYGEGSAALTAAMYDAIAEMQGKILPAAEVAPTPGYGEVAKTVNGTLKHSQNPNSVSNAISRLVKRTGADTMLKNAERDGAQFAWVPSGDTCAFCITLASRGWQYMSKKALKNGHAEHIHANCDCTYAIRFDGKSGVKGYDPQKYQDMYYGVEGSTPNERINSLRRMHYEQNKELIRAQKREAYAISSANQADKNMLTLSARFMNNSDPLYERTKLVHPIDGFEDVFGHGDAYSLELRDSSGNVIGNISAEEALHWLRDSGEYNGGNIRLAACSTGKEPAVVPRYLAKELNVQVMAPSEDVNIDHDGNIILADDLEDAKMGIETGAWLIFNPDGSVKRYDDIHR